MSQRNTAVAPSRLIGAATVALGLVLVTGPEAVAKTVAGRSSPKVAVVRLLGVRYLAQGVAQLARPRASVLAISAVVDVLHAASMFGLAAEHAEYRRPALLSGAVATGSAATTALLARRLRRSGR
jgi:hypothetical protein